MKRNNEIEEKHLLLNFSFVTDCAAFDILENSSKPIYFFIFILIDIPTNIALEITLFSQNNFKCIALMK